MPNPFFRSNLGMVTTMHREIAKAAVTAVAVQTVNRAKRNVRGGFTSGAFVTQGWSLITHQVETSLFSVTGYVGTPLRHFAFWELGHHNIFTRRYERVPWLKPAMMENRILKIQAARRAAGQVARKYGIRSGVLGIVGGRAA